MSKHRESRKPIAVKGQNGFEMKLEWVGPRRPNDYVGYLRFEDSHGNYLGAIDGREKARLRKWLMAEIGK